MAIRGRLQVEGLKEAIVRVDEIGDRARQPERALRAPETLLDIQLGQRRHFARARFRKVTPRWAAEKRRRGLDRRPLRATGLLESTLVNANRGDGARFDVFNAELRWGIRRGRSNVYYAQALAKDRRRRPVVIDKTARQSIAARVETFIAEGFMTGPSHV